MNASGSSHNKINSKFCHTENALATLIKGNTLNTVPVHLYNVCMHGQAKLIIFTDIDACMLACAKLKVATTSHSLLDTAWPMQSKS